MEPPVVDVHSALTRIVWWQRKTAWLARLSMPIVPHRQAVHALSANGL